MRKIHGMRMWWMMGLAAVCILIVMSRGSANAEPTPTPARSPENLRERIKSIRNYTIYYGKGRLDDLARFDLAIIQPDTLTPEELKTLKARSTLVVAYLSVGEVEPTREWYRDGRVQQGWLLGTNQNWGSYYVDARQQGWRKLTQAIMGEFMALGFDGVFLDTVDTVDLYPDTATGMIALIGGLRTVYPDALLIQNRGFYIAPNVASSLDALLFEGASTTYNFTTKTYSLIENATLVGQVRDLSQRTGLPVLSLDYVPPDRKEDAQKVDAFARANGFIPAISVIHLDDIPDYGLSTPPPKNEQGQ